jgi:hypothetical protein
MYEKARKLIRDIMSDTKRQDASSVAAINQNYQVIRETFMRGITGGINAKQQQETKRLREQEELKRVKDPSSLLPGAPPPSDRSVEELIPSAGSSNQLMNPFFVMGIAIFFTEYAKIIQSLPS